MEICYHNTPFDHVIIYDYFDEEELKLLYTEAMSIKNDEKVLDEILNVDCGHHKTLKLNHNTETVFLDSLFENNRDESEILKLVRKIFSLDLDYKNKNYLRFIPISNYDLSTLHFYKNGSRYFEHKDTCLFTALTVFWKQPKTFTGGDLIFSEYNYKPELRNNTCIIFPGYLYHYVDELKTKDTDFVRMSLNYRLYLKPHDEN